MNLNLRTVGFAADAMRMLNRARLSVNGLCSLTGVEWLIAAGINFSSTTALRFADLEGLPLSNTMGPVNARPLQDVKLNHDEGNREERPGRFLTTRAPIGQHVKRFRQIKAPPGHVKERVYPKQVNQEGDVQRYGELKAIKKNETIFAAYNKAEMRKASIMIVANSDFIHTSKSLFWHYNVGSGRPGSNAVGVNGNRGTTTHGNEPNHNRICQPTTAEDTVWPAIKDIESMGEVVDTLKESAFRKITPKACLDCLRDMHISRMD